MRTNHSVNQRACSRTPVDMDVTLFCDRRTALLGKLVDVSFGGAFIETNSDPLKLNASVTLDLRLPDDDAHVCTLAAVVVRKTNDGAGLIFDDYDGATVRCLRKIYRRAIEQPFS